MRTSRSAWRRAGACASAVVVAGVTTSVLAGTSSAAVGTQPGNDDGRSADRGQGVVNGENAYLETCAPNVGGTKVPFMVQGFFPPVSMVALNTIQAGAAVPLKLRVIATADNCVIQNTAAMGETTVTRVACPGELGVSPVPVAFEGSPWGFDAYNQQFVRIWKSPSERGRSAQPRVRPGACYDVTQRLWASPTTVTAHCQTTR